MRNSQSFERPRGASDTTRDATTGLIHVKAEPRIIRAIDVRTSRSHRSMANLRVGNRALASSGRPAKQMPDPVDSRMMQRCLALAMEAADRGEQPYAAVIARDGQFVCESITSVRYDRDVTRHAELVAISTAFRQLNRISLEDCTIYSNAEPCALCSYAMRETRIGRVVYSIPAPLTGGVSRWRILADDELSDRLPEVFAPPPEIVPGCMREEAESALARRAPLAWKFTTGRNVFGGPLPVYVLAATTIRRRATMRGRAMAFLRRHLFDRFGRK